MGKITKTIKGRIVLQTAIYLLLAIVVCGIASIITLRSSMTTQVTQYINKEAQNNANVLNEWLNAQGNIVHTMCNSVSNMDSKDADAIMDYLNRNLSDNKDALMYYLCYGYDGGVFPADHSKIDLDPTTRDWWKQAISQKQLIYTAPYKDFASGKMVVTIAEPVKVGEEQAVVLADITIDTLTSIVKAVGKDKNVQGFLLDAQGNVITHENKAYLPKKSGSTVLKDALKTDIEKVSQLKDYDGEWKYIATSKVETTGWTLGVLEKKSVITDQIVKNIIYSIILGVILLGIVLTLMYRSVSKNLKPMGTMKTFIKEKVIGTANCQKQKDEVKEIQYLIDELEEQFVSVIRKTKGESGTIHDKMKEASDKVATISSNIMSISATMQETGANVDSQTESIQNINLTTEEAAEAVDRLAEDAQDMALKAGEVMERVDKVVPELIKGKENAIMVANDSRERLKEAIEGTKVIGQIADVSTAIQEIAAQTNLLSLNAPSKQQEPGKPEKDLQLFLKRSSS